MTRNEMWLQFKWALPLGQIVLFAWVYESIVCQSVEYCREELSNPGCVCSAAPLGFTLNITTLLPYPVVLRDRDRPLFYSFSPCERIVCNGVKATLCQYDIASNQSTICGVDPLWAIQSLNPLVFTVRYTYGNRVVVANFHEDNSVKTNFTSAIVEKPKHTYTFSVHFYVTRTIPSSPVASARPNPFLSSAWFFAITVATPLLCVCLAVVFVTTGTIARLRVLRKRRKVNSNSLPQRKSDIQLRPLPSIYLEIVPSPTVDVSAGKYPTPQPFEHIYENPHF